jgi:hypothetical protein
MQNENEFDKSKTKNSEKNTCRFSKFTVSLLLCDYNTSFIIKKQNHSPNAEIDKRKANKTEMHETYLIPPSYHFQEKASSPKHTNSRHAK